MIWTSDLAREISGQVLTDDSAREAVSTDFGRLVVRKPAAVVRPRSAEDVARVVKFAAGHGLGVATRGAGHSQTGQSLSEHIADGTDFHVVGCLHSQQLIHVVVGHTATPDDAQTQSFIGARNSSVAARCPDCSNARGGGYTLNKTAAVYVISHFGYLKRVRSKFWLARNWWRGLLAYGSKFLAEDRVFETMELRQVQVR